MQVASAHMRGLNPLALRARRRLSSLSSLFSVVFRVVAVLEDRGGDRDVRRPAQRQAATTGRLRQFLPEAPLVQLVRPPPAATAGAGIQRGSRTKGSPDCKPPGKLLTTL